MILKRACYILSDSYGSIQNWHLTGVDFQDLNLVVGTNSTGKSRLLTIIKAFGDMLLQKAPIYSGQFDFVFQDREKGEISYLIECKATNEGREIKENIKLNNQTILERLDNDATIHDFLNREDVNVSPPSDELTPHIRRDIHSFPVFELLIEWAKNVHKFNFGHIHSQSFLSGEGNLEQDLSKKFVEILEEADDDSFLELVKELLDIEFDIESIRYSKNEKELYIKEKNVIREYGHRALSQGMFRSLALLLFVKNLTKKEEVSCILIDDLCEGLDYNRSSRLGELIFNKFSNSGIQLIATSNDSFLMDKIPIKYWNILVRKGEKITSFNIENSKEKFQKFELFGLNNFDLFTSDYLEKI